MTSRPTYDEVDVGAQLPEQTFSIRRVDLIRYCGASGDSNVLHWNDRSATAVGLPGVIAHGMFTMATAIRIVTDWTGDPASVVDYGVRFSRPVPVPDDDDGTVLTVRGRIEEKLADKRVVVGLTVTNDEGRKVLANARATVSLP